MAGEQTVRIAGRRLRVTNLDKVIYPETGTTKGEVIDYYTRIAPLLLPHVTGRPVTRKRWPDGVGTPQHPGTSFFGKQLEAGAPEWVRRRPIEHSGGPKDYPVIDDVATLVYLAQVASLELHVPQWRFAPDGGRGHPDRLVLDLDPGANTGLTECAEVARWCRTILEGMDLTPYPVTSGSKGIHLYAALPGEQTSESISTFAKELARAIEADHPDLVVSAMSKSVRAGRVLIDWSQNNAAKTTVAPYSLRGRLRPTVAAPRTWDELDAPDLAHLTFDEVLARVDAADDPMRALGLAVGSGNDGPLAAYIAKRSADRTPEPLPDTARGAASPPDERPRFVIQEHHASRLHWDLRLERDGVLVSWAVPRGVPQTSVRNNLAVMTEDHPLEYATFEGTIPAGQYGAGTMTIWDEGRYDLEKWREDEVIFTAQGRAGGPLGTVRLALIRTDGAGEKSSWLLHRMKTDAAGRRQAAVSSASDHGAVPAPARKPPPARHDRPARHDPPAPNRLAPMLSESATEGIARASAERWAEGERGPWVEFKWDGIRALGVWTGAELRLIGRRGTDFTERYPEVTGAAAALGSEPAVVDGELVALDDRGRPSFPRLQNRMNLTLEREIRRAAPRTPVTFYLFDILEHAGEDVAGFPLSRRRALLERAAAGISGAITLPPVVDDVDAALETARAYDLEGIVVKDPRSPYRRGERAGSWLKVKLTRTQEVVIGGIRPGRGGRAGTIGSLLIAVPDDEGLRYAGRVGTGFTDAALTRLREALEPLRTDENPLVGVPPSDAADAVWVRPQLVGEVEFAEFTPGGILRHPRWRGLRPDKRPDEVIREG